MIGEDCLKVYAEGRSSVIPFRRFTHSLEPNSLPQPIAMCLRPLRRFGEPNIMCASIVDVNRPKKEKVLPLKSSRAFQKKRCRPMIAPLIVQVFLMLEELWLALTWPSVWQRTVYISEAAPFVFVVAIWATPS